jgi:[glutamine synthetase] adenylyltransferase / [glutamine synthetase]-adenylyl-L-tyrosine phosphorylase
MRPKTSLIDRILQHAPGTRSGDVATFLARLQPDYSRKFPPTTIACHLLALQRLSPECPVQVLLDERPDKTIECAILAFDYPFEFSCITGLMAATGFSIDRSDAYTLKKIKSAGRIRTLTRDLMRNAVILDCFHGKLLGPLKNFTAWSKAFTAALEQTVHLLEQQNSESTDRAKRLVNERATLWLAQQKRNAHTAEMVSLEIEVRPLKNSTRLRLRAPDTPAFLYALSTALSLHDLQIEKTRARTAGQTAIDEIDIVDRDAAPLTNRNAIQQLRRSVLLTLQFAYFLDRASDPFTALQRFEQLASRIVRLSHAGQWLDLLASPGTLIDLAKLLGASNFLWEDFLSFNADVLLPVLQCRARGQAVCPPERTLPLRLEQTLAGIRNFDEQRKRLNEFKDRELFLIDLDHILTSENPDEAFRILSERLVFLAENLLSAAIRPIHTELVRLYGWPTGPDQTETSFAVFGLGKLGGVALGYASDIELLFLFDNDGSTAGGTRGALTNAEFFSILTRETCAYIQSTREGIFHVDLRLRPYGSAGPLACSKSDFAAYYTPNGPAHEFEKLALVRLRWIAGDPTLGYEIEQLRDQFIYESATPNFSAVWEISAKMRAQHTRGAKYHSKHSAGALADLEQTVQMLQVLHAREAPQLRTPRLQEAINALRRAGILSAEEFEQLISAYQFFRRLINAQRMLRGSARDLFLPDESSDELRHLTRRMNWPPSLLADFRAYTETIKKIIRQKFPTPK